MVYKYNPSSVWSSEKINIKKGKRKEHFNPVKTDILIIRN